MTNFDPYATNEADDWADDEEEQEGSFESPEAIRDFAMFQAEFLAKSTGESLEELRKHFSMIAEDKIEQLQQMDTESIDRLSNSKNNKSISAGGGVIQKKILRTRGRSIPSPRFEPYDAFAFDGDGDGIVQEGTIWERPAGTKFVDKLGREVAHELTLLRPSPNHRLVNADNDPVDYTPAWRNKAPERLGPSIRTIVSPTDRLEHRSGRRGKLLPLRVEALKQWFNGDTMNMREHTIAILNNEPIESMPGIKWRSAHTRAKVDRAATAALMDFVSDGSPYDKPLYRGELLPMNAESLIDELAPGTEFVLPMRSFSRDESTAMDYFDSDYANDFEEGTLVIYELLPGSQGADFQEIAAQLEQEGHSYDQTWSSEDRFMLSSDVEHVIFGTVEVVEVQQVSHPKFGPIFRVILRQTDTLGKPADRDTWS